MKQFQRLRTWLKNQPISLPLFGGAGLVLIIAVGIIWHTRANTPTVSPTPHYAVSLATPVPPPPRPSVTPQVVQQHANYHPIDTGYILEIDKLKVKVPIIINVVGTDQKQYLAALDKGVAHYKGTPPPGEGGNSYIFGHSSYYYSIPYATVFAHLNQLKIGDRFVIVHEKTTYTYKVINSQIIAANDFQGLAESKTEMVSLSTCWPPGTLDKRYLVQAKRVS
ncbi:sortase [Patescibacteria group bacterium]|nr:sortase [Patescibacteria group bacterium]